MKIKALIKRAVGKFQRIVLPLCAATPITSSLFFTVFSRDFFYEHQAILKARLQYLKQGGQHGRSSALLRRNIHRIEKGLIMRPRRSVFALDYITETVLAYKVASARADYSSSELQWATDVLFEYFSVVDSTHEKIQLNQKIFNGAIKTLLVSNKKPYQQKAKATHSINYEQLAELIKSRRSTRWFTEQAVELDKIKAAVELASQAPSACNRQPYQFYVINQQPLLRKLANLPGGTAGFADNIRCLIAVVGDLSYYPLSRDRHVIYIDASLASMQFMLALETLGLSSCPINWPELYTQDQKVSQLLGLAQYKRVVMFIAVGYADDTGQIAFSDKKSADELVVSFNE
ncbi:nitroreductase family protein [Pseudoalteromonas shioyasakiensis]|uniref:nitroreductase family protein n=1 Tax=Pseudoalteromonas shioyasakiensis TaxID=1190813 RepID=UPI002117E33B|nr:nitroreductase family protein [Pseudoalteromonas shioyasakiensis]MCQ8879450.1 nitroreductase family protein [Pseudoalteromonas shioyasakiensis]